MIQNTGQAIWQENELYLNESPLIIGHYIKPGESRWLQTTLSTKPDLGISVITMNLIRNNQKLSQEKSIKVYIYKPIDIWKSLVETKNRLIKNWLHFLARPIQNLQN